MTSRQEPTVPPLYWPSPRPSEHRSIGGHGSVPSSPLKPTWRPQIRSYQAEPERP